MTTIIGTQFENTTLQILSRYGFSLQRVGGANDKGIDLIGHFQFPHSQIRFPILVQCKKESKKIGPKYIRELSGVVYAQHSQSTQSVGVFASHSIYSQQALYAFASCTSPLILTVLDSNNILQFLLNSKAQSVFHGSLTSVSRHQDGIVELYYNGNNLLQLVKEEEKVKASLK